MVLSDRFKSAAMLFSPLLVWLILAEHDGSISLETGSFIANVRHLQGLSMLKVVALIISFTTFLYLVCVEVYWKLSNVVFLVDLHCFKPPERLRVHRKWMSQKIDEHEIFTKENSAFQNKIIDRSGLGEETYLSDGIIALKDGLKRTTYNEAKAESEMILYDCVENLLKKAHIQPREVDMVIVSCSCFAPTPSMAAMIVNHFHMKQSVLTYNLSGMGCSSSIVCVDLAKHLLKALPNKLVLIVNHENITNCWYGGQDREMLVPNCLFRLGGAAALLSNRRSDAPAAKYELVHTVRTHLGGDDEAFGCMGVAEDAEGVLGVFLKRNVVGVAQKALVCNMRVLGRLVLPWMEQARYVVSANYTPDFKKAFDHFLLHTGGRGVLDSLETHLHLTVKQLAPARATLERYGNTSAASTWYILANLEHNGMIRKGDRLWQLGFGGGFKCNSAVWRARRSVKQPHTCWA